MSNFQPLSKHLQYENVEPVVLTDEQQKIFDAKLAIMAEEENILTYYKWSKEGGTPAMRHNSKKKFLEHKIKLQEARAKLAKLLAQD